MREYNYQKKKKKLGIDYVLIYEEGNRYVPLKF